MGRILRSGRHWTQPSREIGVPSCNGMDWRRQMYPITDACAKERRCNIHQRPKLPMKSGAVENPLEISSITAQVDQDLETECSPC